MVVSFPVSRVMQVACVLLLIPGVGNFLFPHKANQLFGYPSEEALKNADTVLMVRVLGFACFGVAAAYWAMSARPTKFNQEIMGIGHGIAAGCCALSWIGHHQGPVPGWVFALWFTLHTMLCISMVNAKGAHA